MVHRTTRALLEACAEGGSAADWEEFSDRFSARLACGVRRGFRRAGCRPRPDQLEDLVQECYCKLLERNAAVLRRCHSDTEPGIGAYLARIAERVALDYLRAGATEKRGGGRVASLDEIATRRGEPVWAATPAGAEERLLCKERIERFLECCWRIAGRRKERDVRIMRMALVEGLTSREISERIGDLISPTGIDTLLCRARQRLVLEGIILPRRRPVSAS